MENFTCFNPTRIVFGKGSIAKLSSLMPRGKILLTYGQGSIRKNGVYEQVMKALGGCNVVEFGGIEANPRYETCMKAVELVRSENIGFILAAGGGSVLDGTKFIAAASNFKGGDPWKILSEQAPVESAVPLASVLTLPATGSEMNGAAVVSRNSTNEKLYFISDNVRPVFSILDPETTYSLPAVQTANGIADTFVHVTEQYLTYPADAPLQDRQAEAILKTVIEEAAKVFKEPDNYAVRANLMWCATQALNGVIGCGVPQDWTSHEIGHELTALYGLDHGQTLAIVLPAVLRHERESKMEKLVQYAGRVWNITEGDADYRSDFAIDETEKFFRSLGIKTRLSEYGVKEDAATLVAARLSARGSKLGEKARIGSKEIEQIVGMCF